MAFFIFVICICLFFSYLDLKIMSERTTTLRELFNKNTPYHGGCDNFASLSALKSHPFYRAFQVVSSAAETSVRATRSSVKAALRAIEEFSPAVSDQESALLLHEAELLSASNAVRELSTSLKEGISQLGSSGSGSELFSRKEEGVGKGSATPSQHMLLHLLAGLETIEMYVGRWRLFLALCKEELMLYKREMFSFGRLSIFSCKDPARRNDNYGDVRSSSPVERKDKTQTAVLLTSSGDKNNSASKPKLAARVMVSVVDRVMKEATRRVSSTPLSVNSQVWSAIRGKVGVYKNTWGSNIPDNAVPQFEYSEKEEELLKEAGVQLEQRQRQVSAEDAKMVEASVRELSQLTSLMNERVVQQNEQFSILLKNTEAAHSNMQKGVTEVKVTLTYFWNSTRQLIAILWISIFTLLTANWLIR
uniref:Uncharacterized protein TCIL3000_10_8410 n=1 Tax=Trypanosoma congolense (strain IL3000) TaxID=1068625 RepID=G0UXE8_TRYCI|nr:unnamed protein product [Trypanosoma congolense IL3000]